jgi:putative addiction module component (TIGR02574 family)
MAKLTPQVLELLEKALALSTQERGLLIDRLVASLDDEPSEAGVEAAWGEEIKRRVEDIRSGRVRTIPGERVLRKLAQEFPGEQISQVVKSRSRRKGVVDVERWFAKLDEVNQEPFPSAGRQPKLEGSTSRRRRPSR